METPIQAYDTHMQPPRLAKGVEDRMPALPSFLYGLQHVFVSNVWLDPLFIAAMVGMPLATAPYRTRSLGCF
jgi:hypothetical protein